MQETPVPEIIALNASIRRPETRQTERGDQFQRDIRRRQPFRRINTNLQQTTDPGCEKCGLVVLVLNVADDFFNHILQSDQAVHFLFGVAHD